jgi:hypothetical protein
MVVIFSGYGGVKVEWSDIINRHTMINPKVCIPHRMMLPSICTGCIIQEKILLKEQHQILHMIY